jgi:glycosyltransferase involved in cell wall biosynthesis
LGEEKMPITEGRFIERNQPFLSIITRCYKRPESLAHNIASLQQQTLQDFKQVYLVDDIGRGMEWANGQFYRHRDKAKGKYVLMLDDDDMLSEPRAIEKLLAATQDSPEVVFFRFDCGKVLGILPDDENWRQAPAWGRIGTPCFITRLDVWQNYIWTFTVPEGGDFHFISAVWPHLTHVIWLDEVLGRVQRKSYGFPEE